LAAAALLLLAADRTCVAASPALIEMTVGEIKYVGKSVAHNEEVCCLVATDGRMTEIDLKKVAEFRQVAPTFKPLSVIDVRDQLARELGRGFEVATRGKYVVAGPPGKARQYAELLDQVHRSFTTFFSRRNFGLTEPEFPLIAIVFPDVRTFADYCRKDGMGYAPGLRGYYDAFSNRVALYDEGEPLASVDGPGELSGMRFATIQAGLRDTLVHEATHQLAFNMGLHSRVGENPRWVVEGLAMIFERDATGGARYGSEKSRINEERFEWFVRETRGRPVPLKEFVAGDRSFRNSVLNAYSQSWAVAFYLAERRAANFADFLRRVRGRKSLTPYTAEERVADFQASFGDDIDWVEVQWLRFMDGLK
jgi:hypothetical protein